MAAIASAKEALAKVRDKLGPVLSRSDGRAAVALAVVALHVALAYLLILALAQHAANHPAHELTISLSLAGPRAFRSPPKALPPVIPKAPEVPDPEVKPADPLPNAILAVSAPATPGVTMPAEAIGESRSLPDLSDALMALARKARLRLKLLISPDGTISEASVDSSTGSPEIDNLALAWVKTHWRYRPAMRDGAAISESTTALVPF